jgi:hypothetical protein
MPSRSIKEQWLKFLWSVVAAYSCAGSGGL